MHSRPTRAPGGLTFLEKRLKETYLRLGARNQGVLLAVSGGADSTALLLGTLRVAPDLGLRLSVLTLDHGLRPESNAECEAVCRMSERLGVAAATVQLRLARANRTEDLEGRARAARYRALEAHRKELGFEYVATAHTASDQAETLLMRLVRGSALRGAVAIQETRAALLRPLLSWTRAEVETYLDLREQRFVKDPMNADSAFLRSRIRHQVLPVLEQAARHEVTHKLSQFASLAAEDDAYLSSLAAAALERLTLSDGTLDAIGLRALLGPVKRRVIAEFLSLSRVTVDFELVQAGVSLLEGGPPHSVGGDRTLRLKRGRLELTKNPPRKGKAAKNPVRYRLERLAQRLSKGQ